MPARSATPGLIVIKRKSGFDLYWAAKSLARDIEGYPDPLLRVPKGLDEDAIMDFCERHTAKFRAWQLGQRGAAYRTETINDLCAAFERHPQSPMQKVKRNTHGAYYDSLKIIRATVGPRQVRSIKPVDVFDWYDDWSMPVGDGTPRLKRAHDAVAMLRAIMSFGYVLGDETCGKIRDQMREMRFKRSGRRESAMTHNQVLAFIEAAHSWPEDRRMMALGIATQWDTMLRQKDVIGEYQPGGEWVGQYTWENMPGWKWTVKTSKTKAAITFDLAHMSTLWPLLQAVPQSERVGAVLKYKGRPMKERTYRKWFRQIANKAGIPRDVWNMDSRAGAVTEALEAGASYEKVARAATHSRPEMTKRYDRVVAETVVEIAEARKGKRG
jgi:hypothetical protein